MGDIFNYRKREKELNEKLNKPYLMSDEKELLEKLKKINNSDMHRHC